MTQAQRALDKLIPNEARDRKAFIEIGREAALNIIEIAEKTMKFEDDEFEWDAMRGLLDYYSDIREGGEGKVLMMAETGRKLSRERSGDKSGLSIIGGDHN